MPFSTSMHLSQNNKPQEACLLFKIRCQSCFCPHTRQPEAFQERGYVFILQHRFCGIIFPWKFSLVHRKCDRRAVGPATWRVSVQNLSNKVLLSVTNCNVSYWLFFWKKLWTKAENKSWATSMFGILCCWQSLFNMQQINNKLNVIFAAKTFTLFGKRKEKRSHVLWMVTNKHVCVFLDSKKRWNINSGVSTAKWLVLWLLFEQSYRTEQSMKNGPKIFHEEFASAVTEENWSSNCGMPTIRVGLCLYCFQLLGDLFKLIAIIIFSERLLFNTSLPVYFILCPSRSVTDPNTHTHTHSDLAPNYLPHKRLLITSTKQLFLRLEITSSFFFLRTLLTWYPPCLWWMMLQSSRVALPSANSCSTHLGKGVSSPLGWLTTGTENKHSKF